MTRKVVKKISKFDLPCAFWLVVLGVGLFDNRWRKKPLAALCLAMLLFAGCVSTNDKEDNRLQTATEALNTDAAQALMLLESLPNPQLLSYENHLEYIVLLAQARDLCDQPASADTLILEAQRFFVHHRHPQLAAPACYYAAAHYQNRLINSHAIDLYHEACAQAEQANNFFLAAKSNFSIASIYYHNQQPDSALQYAQKSLDMCEKAPQAQRYKIDMVCLLGQIHYALNQHQQAQACYANAIETAQRLNNKTAQAKLLNCKGQMFCEKKHYQEAKACFVEALAQTSDPENVSRVYLNYARMYHAIQKPDSANHYLEAVKDQLVHTTTPATRKALCQELVLYYEHQGNASLATLHQKQAHAEDQCIVASRSQQQEHLVSQHIKRTTQHTKKNYHNMLAVAALVVATLGLLAFVLWRDRSRYLKRSQTLRFKYLMLKMELQHSLLGGMRFLAQSTEILFKGKPSFTAAMDVREQFRLLRNQLKEQLAELVCTVLPQLTNGEKALPYLNIEDLCIIHLSQLNYSNESILHMLGYEHRTVDYVLTRKKHIQSVLGLSGMPDDDIKLLFPE